MVFKKIIKWLKQPQRESARDLSIRVLLNVNESEKIVGSAEDRDHVVWWVTKIPS